MTLQLPWRTPDTPLLPWQRQGLQDRMASEVRRLAVAHEWFKRFTDSSVKARLEEVNLYTVPPKTVDPVVQAKIHAYGRISGLTPLYDDNVFTVVAAFPDDVARPADNRYIRIISGTRETIIGVKGPVPILVVDAWELLDGEQAWLDVEMEPVELPKIYNESLQIDEHLSNALLAPVTSSPGSNFGAGGLSLASFRILSRASSVQFLLDALEAGAPPEMRASAKGALYKGAAREVAPGVEFLFAHRPPPARDTVETFLRDQTQVAAAQFDRGKPEQETSIYGALSLATLGKPMAFRHLMQQATSADLLFPERLDTIVEQGANLQAFAKAVNDDRVWAAVTKAHYLAPSLEGLGPEIPKYGALLSEVVDTELVMVEPNEAKRRPWLRQQMDQMEPAMMRLALEQARLAGRTVATPGDLHNAFRLLKANFHHLWNENPEARTVRLGATGIADQSSRTGPIQTALLAQPGLTPEQLFARVKHTEQYEDAADVQRYMEWAYKRGLVTLDQKGGYHWVQ